MTKTSSDADLTVTPVAEAAASMGDNDSPTAYTMDQTTIRMFRSRNAEPKFWTIVAPSDAADQRELATMPIPRTTYWDAFCDLWTSPDDLAPTPLDFGYDARLRDMQRIGGDFDRAIAGLGLRERLMRMSDSKGEPTPPESPERRV